VSGSSEPPDLIGDRYHVLGTLGRGGSGVVYRVHDPGSHRELALKQLLIGRPGAKSGQSVALFEREFYVLAQLSHPRVIAVYDYGVDPAGPFYTMELLDGGDLTTLAPLPVTRACSLMLDVCSSLSLLHARRLVHRDITPRNVRCTRDGHAKLIDFGAMLPMGPCTHTVGTPAFIAPEAVHHSTLDARTDLYSLGATLYYALTGRTPFAVRTFAELRDAWSGQLVPPSHWVSGIPPALDLLCAALLRLDPAQRPRSTFEVMQRLQAISGIEHDEPESAGRAYLTTPALVGREALMRRVRSHVRRALHGDGAALRIESPSGFGRSRALDACALEAKTLGAIVLRASAGAGKATPFAGAQQLCEQVLQTLPDIARVVADNVRASRLLFEHDPQAHDDAPRMRSLQDPSLDRAELQAALGAFFGQLCDSHALLLAIDDVEHMDEASIALLAVLALQARRLRIVICATCDTTALADASEAFKVLQQQCTPLPLAALSRTETQDLLVSCFGNASHVELLAERLYQLAVGVPRETLELAQHLIDTGSIRYEHARWTLPSELDGGELPRSIAEALAARIRALPPLARRLAESHALLGGVLRDDDFCMLAPDAVAVERDAAVLALLHYQVVQSDGEFYRLRHRALADALCALLDPDQKRVRHLELYALYRRRKDVHPYVIVHHLLEAGEHAQALDVLAELEHVGEQQDIDATRRVGVQHLAAILERALNLALALQRPPREVHELQRRLCSLAMLAIDEDWSERVAPAWLAQLERDSGLRDYFEQDSAQPASARLQRALAEAAARYAAAPETERGYRVDEAIKNLGLYVVMTMVMTRRANDPRLGQHLPSLLAPFAPLSPALAALCENALALNEWLAGRVLAARERWTRVYDQLGQLASDSIHFLPGIRSAAAGNIEHVDVVLGRRSPEQRSHGLEDDPTARVSALRASARRCLMFGDTEQAEELQRSADLLALRANAGTVLHSLSSVELLASVYIRDLAGLTRTLDALAPLAARHAGWKPLHGVARGHFELMRGDPAAAHALFSHALRLAQPEPDQAPIWVAEWCYAVAGFISACSEVGDTAAAVALGTQALTRCAALGVDVDCQHIEAALAFAEAKQGNLESASARIAGLIAAQQALGSRGLRLANSYVIALSIAIAARDESAASRYAALTLLEPGGDKVLAAAVQAQPLLAMARASGLALSLAPTEFESSVLGTSTERVTGVRNIKDLFAGCATKAERAARALASLCEVANAQSGLLYLVDGAAQLTLVGMHGTAEPDPDLPRFVQSVFAQQLDDADMNTGLTQATQMLSLPGAAAYVDAAGRAHRVVTLSCKKRDGLVYVGIAVLRDAGKPVSHVALLAQISLVSGALLDSGDMQGMRPSAIV
jgi:hypothetical protein